jgi:hypothetical protein
MDILKQAAQAVLDAHEHHDPLGVVMADLRAALALPERKPLTEAEIAEIAINCLKSSVSWNINFARAIERAHGIE